MSHDVLHCRCIASRSASRRSGEEVVCGIRETYTLCFISKGKGTAVIDSKRYHLSEGNSLAIFPFSSVVLKADENNPWTYHWVEFSGSQAVWMINQTTLCKSIPIVGRMPVKNFERCFDIPECKMDSDYAQCRAAGKLISLLSYYVENFHCECSDSTDYAEMACSFIEKNYRNPQISVQLVADHINIERSYLYRRFKAATGISVIEYINNIRVSKAEILLADDSIPIKDVAYSVGFTDPMYFSRVFKKIRGKAPSEYRKDCNAFYGNTE